ncbi:MAG: hypothetical protein WC385_01670 [Candidatus Paceibacterota bacterium]|jgi:hypothetical protein
MNESTPTDPNLEEQRREEEERCADWLVRHSDPAIVADESRETVIAQFESSVASFELTYPLEKLSSIAELSPGLLTLFLKDRDMTAGQLTSAIGELTPEEAEQYQLRTAAKKDLETIVEMLTSSGKREKLKEQYLRLSRAVGIINGGRVYHDR